jgi:hypothetical protein
LKGGFDQQEDENNFRKWISKYYELYKSARNGVGYDHAEDMKYLFNLVISSYMKSENKVSFYNLMQLKDDALGIISDIKDYLIETDRDVDYWTQEVDEDLNFVLSIRSLFILIDEDKKAWLVTVSNSSMKQDKVQCCLMFGAIRQEQ